MIIIDLIFVCLYWQWGGKRLPGLGGTRMGKVMGRGHHARNLAHRMGICPGLPRKKGFLAEKKPNLALKKESFAGNADGNKVLLKSSSFVEAWAGFCQLIAQAAVVFKKKIWKSWAIQGV